MAKLYKNQYRASDRTIPSMEGTLPSRGSHPPVQDATMLLRREAGLLSASTWGWLPFLSIVMAFGLLLISIAFRVVITSGDRTHPLFWIGLALMVGPTAARLATVTAQRRERLALVVLLAMGLYLVKVMHSPGGFTYSDELVHFANADHVLRTGRLFGENSILRVTPRYPGLPAVTAGIASLTGFSIYTSGLLVIGAARLVITLALFLIYEKLSASSRLAGLAAVFYMGSSNYLYWSAQFAYESLALPLAVFVIFVMLLAQQLVGQRVSRPVMVVALLGILAVTVTHHLTSFAMTALLGLTALVASILRRRSREPSADLWPLALFSLATVVIWNLLVTPETRDYLLPVLQRALAAGADMIAGGSEESGRALFESTGGNPTPAWERLVGIVSVLLILLATPLGLWAFWRRLRTSALAWVLAYTALIFFPLQLLRLTGAGWETANRASEFLFVGIAFIAGLAFTLRRPLGNSFSLTLAAGIMATVVFLGGFISGWPPTLRLPHAYYVSAQGLDGERVKIPPQGVAAGHWAEDYLPPGSRLAADYTSARQMQAYGQQYAMAGEEFGIRALFSEAPVASGEIEILQTTGVEYLVYTYPRDRWERLLGMFYDPAIGLAPSEPGQTGTRVWNKYDLISGVGRLLDTGNLAVYDVGGLRDATTAP